ncbi:helix-turn-helix domain-containing protein [Spongiactinospora rosea]|uniref:helix-turn-helix domain-containing protein n=1 Tax=Spongiactinospora rosea TaxID=2248750 RepID=UPI001CEC17C6|nr:helix-turn-helix transcriptional regulator [Spongiactinospora rosea]
MALRSRPTIRQRRLAAELQRLREAAGVSREDVVQQFDWHSTKMYRIENARSGVTSADMLHLLDMYKVSDDRQRAALLQLARNAREKSWWTKHQDIFPGSYLELEAEATAIRSFEAMFVPGLLQTESYARALMRGSLVTRDIDRRVSARMERQKLLVRAGERPRLWAIIDESTLTRPVGGPAIMRAQIDHLIEAQELENITLQVVRTSVGAHPGMCGAFVLMDFPSPEFFAPLVYLESAISSLYLEDEEQIAQYTLMFDHLRAIALGPDESVRYLETIRSNLFSE